LYGVSLLQPQVEHPPDRAVCPVRGCGVSAPWEPGPVPSAGDRRCPLHRIFLSRTTFRYERETDNLLWTGRQDLALLGAARKGTGERSFGLDSSPGAVTWNVFRWLESTGGLALLLEEWLGETVLENAVAYWGYGSRNHELLPSLRRARIAFAEPESDETLFPVCIETSSHFVVVAPRLGPINIGDEASGRKRWAPERESDWLGEVLMPDWRELLDMRLAAALLRIWALGSYAAKLRGLAFVLLDISPRWANGAAGESFESGLRIAEGRRLAKANWEDVYDFAGQAPHPDADVIRAYLGDKSAGYSLDGRLRRAFSLDPARTATRVS